MKKADMNNSSVYDIQIISNEAFRRAQVHGRAGLRGQFRIYN